MERLTTLFDDENAVRLLIGGIFLIAITIILAAVISSFALSHSEAPITTKTPAFDIDQNETRLNLSKAGGDNFAVADAELRAAITLENTTTGDAASTTFNLTDIAGSQDMSLSVPNGTTASPERVDLTYEPFITDEKMTPGDEFIFWIAPAGGADSDVEITEWDFELVWAPDGQDSEIIYVSTS